MKKLLLFFACVSLLCACGGSSPKPTEESKTPRKNTNSHDHHRRDRQGAFEHPLHVSEAPAGAEENPVALWHRTYCHVRKARCFL